MAEITLNAKERIISRKSANKQLRIGGRIPGIYYHKKDAPISIDVAEAALKPFVYTSETHIISLAVENRVELPCILKNIQFDPITEKIVHFDLLGISRDEKIEIEVPLLFIGNPVGIKQGGMLQQIIHKILVECLPADIPEHIEVKIEQLSIGDAIHAADIKIDKVKILNAPDAVLVTVVPPKVEKEATPAEGEEVKEPEVITKGKVEKEEE
ncbi:MAG: 50S ribosomal protein L25 [Ignavibacteriales bacterium]|nr:50S ribosomal protein L25 [Ignavibacteriales bacterium]